MTDLTLALFDADSPDSLILEAFERIRAARAWAYSFDHLEYDERPNAEIDALDGQMVSDESLIHGNFATTPAGIVARLSLAMQRIDQDRWVDRALCEHGLAAIYKQRERLDGNAQQVMWAAIELLHLDWEAALADYRRSEVDFDLALRVKSSIEEEGFRLASAGEAWPAWLHKVTERAQALEDRLTNNAQIKRLVRTLAPSHEALATKLSIIAIEGEEGTAAWIARDVKFLAGLTVNLEIPDAA